MLDFQEMMDNYEARKVDRYEGDVFFVSTCSILDSDQPYETGICHPRYNDNAVIIVEMYETREDAQVGHDKWVIKMTADKLPQIIENVSTSAAKKLDVARGISNSINEIAAS